MFYVYLHLYIYLCVCVYWGYIFLQFFDIFTIAALGFCQLTPTYGPSRNRVKVDHPFLSFAGLCFLFGNWTLCIACCNDARSSLFPQSDFLLLFFLSNRSVAWIKTLGFVFPMLTTLDWYLQSCLLPFYCGFLSWTPLCLHNVAVSKLFRLSLCQILEAMLLAFLSFQHHLPHNLLTSNSSASFRPTDISG